MIQAFYSYMLYFNLFYYNSCYRLFGWGVTSLLITKSGLGLTLLILDLLRIAFLHLLLVPRPTLGVLLVLESLFDGVLFYFHLLKL